MDGLGGPKLGCLRGVGPVPPGVYGWTSPPMTPPPAFQSGSTRTEGRFKRPCGLKATSQFLMGSAPFWLESSHAASPVFFETRPPAQKQGWCR